MFNVVKRCNKMSIKAAYFEQQYWNYKNVISLQNVVFAQILVKHQSDESVVQRFKQTKKLWIWADVSDSVMIVSQKC